MALDPYVTTDNLSKLPDVLRKEYETEARDDGRHYLQVKQSEDGWALENVVGLKTIANDRKTRHEEAQRKLSEFMDSKGQPITAKQAKEALEALNRLDGLTDPEKIEQKISLTKKQLDDKYKQDLDSRDGEIKGLVDEVSSLLVDGESARILARPEVAGNYKLLIGVIKQHARVERDATSKKFKLRIVDPSTGVAIPTRKQGSSEDMGLEEFILEVLRKSTDYGVAFKATGSTGGGTSGTGNGGVKQRPHGQSAEPTANPTERLKGLRRQQAASGG
jgi:hypothetical protein